MKALARSYVWWPGMDAAIEEWVRRCSPCQETRPEMPRAPVHPWETTRAPWCRLHIDFAGPFQGKTFLIIVDSYSKWLEVIAVSSMTSLTVINALRRLFATHGLPDAVVSDNGPQFTSAEFREFLEANLIRHVTSAPFHPSTNGQAERMVRTTKEALSRIVQGDWSRRLADFLLQQHVTPHSSTGRSPAELLMGRRVSTMLDRLHPDRAPAKSSQQTGLLPVPRSFLPEDPVFARNYGRGPPWVPAVIGRATGPISYEVTLPDGRVLRRHVDQLRRRAMAPCTSEGPAPTEQQPEVYPTQGPSPREVYPRQGIPPGQVSNEPAESSLEEQPTAEPSAGDTTMSQPVPTTAPRPVSPEGLEGDPEPATLRRSQRARKAPSRLRDFVLALAEC